MKKHLLSVFISCFKKPRGTNHNNAKKVVLLFSFFLLVFLRFSYANTITSGTSGGNWSATGTWVGGIIPGVNDSAVINGNVNVDVNEAVGSVTILSAKQLTINSGITLTIATSPAGTGGTIGGWFTNNGTLSNGATNSTVSFGSNNCFIAGTTATTFGTLTINTANTTDIVSLSIPLITVANSGTLFLKKGIFKVGSANTINMGTNGSTTIDASGGGNFATTGINGGQDGGTIAMPASSGNTLTITGTGSIGSPTLYNIWNTADGNWILKLNTAGIEINGTFKNAVAPTSAGYKVTTNGPIWGPLSTLSINTNGNTFSIPAAGDATNHKEWLPMSSGTAGVTPGYPNNVLLSNIGTSSSGFNNGNGWVPTVAWAIAGSFILGDNSTNAQVDFTNVPSFICGGFVLNTNSRFTASKNTITVKGSWTDNQAVVTTTKGFFVNSTSTLTFAGSGSCASQDSIKAPAGSSETFYNLTDSANDNLKLSSPVIVTNTLNLKSGIITTTATNILSVTNTAITAVTGGGSSFINGPIKWTLLASGTNTYLFPVGVLTCPSTNTYLPFKLNSTNSTGSNVVTVQAFSGTYTGTTDGTLGTISNTEYWSLSAGTALPTTTTVGLSRPSGLGSFTLVGASTTSTTNGNGLYTSEGGSSSAGVLTSSSIPSATAINFQLAGISCTPPTFSTNPTGSSSVCVGGSGTLLTVNVTGSGITQYQWFSNTSAVNSGGTLVATHSSSSNSDTYTTSTASVSALYYYCTVTTSAGSCNTATSSVSGLFTVLAVPTANAGSALAGVCQGSGAVTIGTGASFGGSATSAIWTDNSGGGTYTNNGGTTPSTTTWTPAANYSGTVTFTLTTSGGCSTATATKTMVVNAFPIVFPSGYNPPAIGNYLRYDFTSGSPLVNQGNMGGAAVPSQSGSSALPSQVTDRFGNANSAYYLDGITNAWIVNTSSMALTYVPMTEGIWFKTTVAGGTLLGVNIDNAGAGANPDHNLYMDNSGKLVFDIYNGSVHVAVTSPNSYNDGVWHQVIVTITTTAPQTITLYVDGASVASTSTTFSLTSASPRYLLAGVNNLTYSLGDNPSNWVFNGDVDDIILYSGTTLTAAQITNMSAPSIAAVNSCSSTVVTLSSYSLATGTYTVTYNVSGTNTVSSTTATMNFTAGSPGTGTFTTASLPNSGTSNVVNVTALSFSSGSCNTSLNINTPNFTTTIPPVFTTNPTGSSSVCVGGSGTLLTVNVTGSGITQYQWFSNTSAVNSGGTLVATHSSSSNSDTYTTSTASAGALYYYCTVTTSAGSCNTATSSVSGLFTVLAAPTANAGSALAGVCQGSGAVTIGTGASFGGSATSAIWTDNSGGGTYTNNGGTTPSTTTWTPAATYSGTVTFTLTTSGGCSTTTATKTMVVNPVPSFTTNPTGSSSVCVGGSGTLLTVNVTGSGITQYQWFSNTSAVNSGGTLVATHSSSSNSDTYTTSTASAGALYYYCTVTTSAGSCNTATSSVSGLFTVLAAPTANAGSALASVCQKSGAVTIGTGASFGGSATSAIWTDNSGGGTYTNNGGTTPSTTTWTPAATYSGTVTFTLTTSGGCSTATATKTMVVNPVPSFTTNPTGSSSVCVGGSGTLLTVNVTGSGITQYQWFSNTSAVNSGGTLVATHSSSSNSDTYTTSTASVSALYYYCTVTTSAGSCNTATSSVSGLFTVLAAPTANAGSALAGVCQGSGAVTIGTGASFGGSATSAIWTDNSGGGTYTNNGGTTPSTTTWTPAATYSGTVTFTLTTSGGCSTTTATKTMVVTAVPSFYNPSAIGNYLRYDFTNGSPLANQGNIGGAAITVLTGTGSGGSVPQQTTDRFGNASSAYLLVPRTSGSGNSMIENTSSMTPTFVPFTEGIWFKSGTTGGIGGGYGGGLMGFNSAQDGSGGTYGHNIYMNDSGRVIFDTWSGSAHVPIISANKGYNDGNWHQAVATISGASSPYTMTLYIDGAQVSTGTITGVPSSGNFLCIGVNNLTSQILLPAHSWNFTGTVDDAVVYSGTALSAVQIHTLYGLPSITANSSCSGTVVTLSSYSLTTGTYTVTYNASGTNTVSSTTATMNFTAGSPGTGTFTTANLPNAGSSNVVNVTALALSAGSCNATLNINTPSFTTTTNNTWLGNTTNWNDVTNWCTGTAPTSASNVIIPNGLTHYPILSTAGLSTMGYADSIYLGTTGTGAAASLTVGTGGSLSIHGGIKNTGGTFDATSGTIVMAGNTAQSITGANFVNQTIYSLMDSTTSGGLSVDSISIIGELGFPYSGTSSLTISNKLVLVSNATTTAWIGPITDPGGVPKATITGKVIVQRYFPSHRRWRLVTGPVTAASAPTINASWQEGVVSVTGVSNPNPVPGYGTHITGPKAGAYQPGLGYDQSPTNSPSIAYVKDTASWFSIPNTNATKVTAHQGYMLFVRGARNYSIATTTQYAAATNATLRTTGSLNTGVQNIPVVAGSSPNVIGNPYASTINFNSIFSHATTQAALGSSIANNTFYLWDPNIASVLNSSASGTGGWVVLTSNGSGSYIPVPDPRSISPFDVNGDIQSGAAFMVHAQASGFVQIDESDKVSPASTNNDLYLFRPAITLPTMLRTTLYVTVADTISYLSDGVLNMFNSGYSNDVDFNKDIQKQANLNEQCSIIKSGRLLAVQRSLPVNVGDTIFLQMAHLNKLPYRFVFEATNFNRPDLNAYLIDTFMHTTTPVSLGDSVTNINFSVTAVSGSAAAGRFAITFRPAPGSVTYTNVTATTQNKTVLVQWTVSNQLNIKEYVVEKSTDGVNFYPVDTALATSGSSTSYSWLDTTSIIATNYYKIRNIDNIGMFQESNTVKASVITSDVITASGMVISPNPVINGNIGLQMNNMPIGEYGIKVIDASGQVLLMETIDHSTATEIKNIFLNNGTAKGIYILEVRLPDNSQTKIKFVNQ